MAGPAGRNQVGGGSWQHGAEGRARGEPRPVDRLRDRHPLRRAIAAAGNGVEAEIGGAGVGYFVQLRQALWIARKGEQLRAGEAVGDVDGTAYEPIEAFCRFRLDLDVDVANLRPRPPVVGEPAEMQAVAAVPLIEVVGAAPRRGGSMEAGIVQPVGR